MSLNTGLIAIEGNHLKDLTDIFNLFGLKDANEDVELVSWQKVTILLDEEYFSGGEGPQRKVIWFDNGWTIISDFSFLLSSDEEALVNISKKYAAKVFVLMTQGTSSSYGFSLYDNDNKREFFVTGGTININTGTPLEEEQNFNINGNVFYDDIHGLATTLGIDFSRAEQLTSFIVKEFRHEPVPETKPATETAKTKPWWKVW